MSGSLEGTLHSSHSAVCYVGEGSYTAVLPVFPRCPVVYHLPCRLCISFDLAVGEGHSHCLQVCIHWQEFNCKFLEVLTGCGISSSLLKVGQMESTLG